MSVVLILVFLGLALLGMPLAVAFGGASLVGLLMSSVDMSIFATRMAGSVNSFPLMAIPLFMLAGELMIAGGIMERLVALANVVVGRVQGGLANATMVAGAGLASVSGVAVADASALSATLVPPLKRVYGLGFASAVVAASSNLGPIIPPSAAMIVYAFMAGSTVSVGALFMAGVVPGLLLTAGLIITTTLIVRIRGYEETSDRPGLADVVRELVRSLPVLLMPVIVIGGIVAGAFTATEGAAVAVVYAMVLGFFVTRELKPSDLPACLLGAAVTTSVVGALIAFASTLTFLMTIDLLPMKLAAAVKDVTTDPLMFLLLVSAMLFVVDMFIESNAAYIMLVPLFHPIAVAYGIDPTYFGFIFVFNLVIGMLTPPVGVVLMVICGVTNISMGELMKHVWPYLLVMYGVLGLCIAFPPIVTTLPRMLGY